MNRTTKNAPFGTDNTPLLEYKIVGGKRVEILAQVSHSEKSNNSDTINSAHRGPHGTPSMSTQPMFRDYEYADLLRGYNTAKQHEIAREISSYTSPFGDRTQSFRHGVPVLNKHPVLPPIGKSQPPGSDYIYESVKKEDFQNISDSKNISDASLQAAVAQTLRGYNSHKIKDMYVELSGFDRKLSGFVSEPQLSLIALRHNLPLKLSTLKLLCRQFSDTKDPLQINYERFLQFLSSCMSNPRLTETSAVQYQDSIVSSATIRHTDGSPLQKTQESSSDSKSYSIDEKLVVMLREQLIGCDDFDLGKLKKSLLNADRLGNGELKADVILHACVNERLPLTSSILTHMLQQAEIAHGIVNWRQFLAPLECACKQLNLYISIAEKSPAVSHKSNPTSSTTSWKIDQNPASEKGQQSTMTTESDKQDVSSRKISLRNQLSAGWDERQPLGSKEPLSSAQVTTSKRDVDSSPRRTESWMKNFTRLAHALKSYHPFKSDILPRVEVERMVNNYNLIYGLGFSPSRISDAIERAVAESQSVSEDQPCVSVELFLNNLSGMSRKD